MLLLHGIGLRAVWLGKLERTVRAAGFATLNLDYPSRRLPLEQLVEHLREQAGAFIADTREPIHFVGHSMGGLLARAYVTRYRPTRLGGVVMLGPPNQGSEIADLLMRNFAYRRFFGPAGQQLGTGTAAAMRVLLGTVDYPLGVIAGDRAEPLLGRLLPKPNDGKVAVLRTVVPGMTDHITLHTTHTLMLRHPEVLLQTVHFLRHGEFARPDHASPGVTERPDASAP